MFAPAEGSKTVAQLRKEIADFNRGKAKKDRVSGHSSIKDVKKLQKMLDDKQGGSIVSTGSKTVIVSAGSKTVAQLRKEIADFNRGKAKNDKVSGHSNIKDVKELQKMLDDKRGGGRGGSMGTPAYSAPLSSQGVRRTQGVSAADRRQQMQEAADKKKQEAFELAEQEKKLKDDQLEFESDFKSKFTEAWETFAMTVENDETKTFQTETWEPELRDKFTFYGMCVVTTSELAKALTGLSDVITSCRTRGFRKQELCPRSLYDYIQNEFKNPSDQLMGAGCPLSGKGDWYCSRNRDLNPEKVQEFVENCEKMLNRYVLEPPNKEWKRNEGLIYRFKQEKIARSNLGRVQLKIQREQEQAAKIRESEEKIRQSQQAAEKARQEAEVAAEKARQEAEVAAEEKKAKMNDDDSSDDDSSDEE